ncbi:unnamed protein product [Ectocarpus sp. 4 AP-2014]
MATRSTPMFEGIHVGTVLIQSAEKIFASKLGFPIVFMPSKRVFAEPREPRPSTRLVHSDILSSRPIVNAHLPTHFQTTYRWGPQSRRIMLRKKGSNVYRK